MEATKKSAEIVWQNTVKGLLSSKKGLKIDKALLEIVKSKMEVKNG